MSIENDLRKDGIEVTTSLDTLKVNSIAKEISQKLIAAFPEHNFKLGELFIRLSRLKMYMAKVPNGFSEANYFYKNTSIYFNEKVSFTKLMPYAMHECIHYLQERKDKKGHLLRLGLCDLTQYKIHGLGMNEAAVQFATSKAFLAPNERVKYYEISFPTISPSCYPIECNLIQQMAYITGEYVLLDSTFYSTDDFKNSFIEATSEKTFYTLEHNFDTIIQAEEDLIRATNILEDSEKLNSKLNKKIANLKNLIKETFFNSQQLIIESYFDNTFEGISNLEEVESFRRKLYNYKNVIGSIDGNNFYNTYYLDMMAKLENKYNLLESGYEAVNEISLTQPNKVFTFFQKIKHLLFRTKDVYKKID